MNDKKHLAVIEKISNEIEGFDDITCGGLPLGRTTLLMGRETDLALQILVSASTHHGTPGIFVAIEENARRVSANGAETCARLSKTSPARSRLAAKENRMTAMPHTPSKNIES